MSVDESAVSVTCGHCGFSQICHPAVSCAGPDTVSNPLVKTVISLRRKELLYSYRDTFKSLYAVQNGAIKTFHIDVNGQEHIHQFYLPGEIIGLEGFYAGYYPSSAVSLGLTSVCEVTFDQLLKHVADKPNLQQHLFYTFSHRLNLCTHDAAATAEQRLSAFLLDMFDRLHASSTLMIELPMSRYDIGNYLGLAPETTSRIFTRFQNSRLIRVQNKKIMLMDPVKLRWIAEEGVQHCKEVA